MNINYLNFSGTTCFHEGRTPFFTLNIPGKIFRDSQLLNEQDCYFSGFSTRIGGVSNGIYESMNLSFTVGDDEENVRRNFEIIGDAMGIPVHNMVYSKQTHTTNVMRVTSEHKGMGIYRNRDFDDIDGLITNEPGVCLVTSYADCVPLFVVDYRNKAIGLSHSGWRGTVGDIAGVTVGMMKEEFGSNPKDLGVFIGPSICHNCYEVGDDVALEFIRRYGMDVFDSILYTKDNGKYKLNLHNANLRNFINAGVLEQNIAITDICTCCNPKLLFSHRASKGKRGGLCGFFMIR